MGGWGVPGVGAERAVTESELLWGADQARNGVLWQSAVVSGAARDAGNTPTTVLRPGLILGKLTSGGKLEEFDWDTTDGTEKFFGVLDTELRAQDFDANNADRVFRVIVARAPVKARSLLIEGAAFVGHAAEFLARRAMTLAGFIFDDDPAGYLAGLQMRTVAKAADYTVLTSDNGALFTNLGAAAKIIFTLPAIKPGLEYHFYSEDNDGLQILAATADTIVTHNDVAADSIDLAVTARNIGGRLSVRANSDGTKWLATPHVWNIADDGSTITKFAVNT
jgi:hypothetical protein